LAQNNFVRTNQGQLVIAKLDSQALQQIASKGQGLFQELELSDDDVEGFQQFFSQDKSSLLNDKKTTVEHWHNEGIWLLWLLLLPVLLLFRKGYLFSMGLCVLVLGVLTPQPASAFTWDELWLNADQRAHRALLNDENEQAKALFKSQDWKASAAYKNGDFEESVSLFEGYKTADGYYNKANALAKSGKLEEAIESYSQAMAMQSDHLDAKFNQDLLKKMLEQQKKDQQSQQDQQNNKNQEEKNKDQEGKDDKKQEGKSGEGDEKQEGQQSEEEKKAKQEAEEAKKAAEEEAKEREEAAKKAAEKKAAEEAAKKEGKQKPEPNEMTEEQKEQAKQTKQWLHKIPDDSAGLWRRKFQYQYRLRQPAGASSGGQEQQAW
jgi:Ca-activated chloride channel family protein